MNAVLVWITFAERDDSRAPRTVGLIGRPRFDELGHDEANNWSNCDVASSRKHRQRSHDKQ